MSTDFPSITCPLCGLTSYSPGDIENGFCGRCHVYHRDFSRVMPDPMVRVKAHVDSINMFQGCERIVAVQLEATDIESGETMRSLPGAGLNVAPGDIVEVTVRVIARRYLKG